MGYLSRISLSLTLRTREPAAFIITVAPSPVEKQKGGNGGWVHLNVGYYYRSRRKGKPARGLQVVW